ncbi:hypothetical protein ACRALDRAFT_1065813 [Sodiomyces alcalophilus JCM 7366]|uniref:uncharacterized protein n=1 Tax=Sodiomyces alcalophilus JCM 7366 TaxID=591952 RepID=UPI0039B4A585
MAIVTMTTMLREVAAAGPLLWINPATGGGAASTLGLKAWLGIRRLEFAGALVVRQCGCACTAFHHLRRHGRTGRAVVCLEIGIALSTNITPKVDLVLAGGRLQGQSSIGRSALSPSLPSLPGNN